ncbi:MAG: flagellar basal body M-ring protein FliF [Sedimenticola selenatireducens]|uniref:Flagellar M-ring protein n=2 Tax=Sedimenticola selenatireducens TaxID=191960 RepID=A0A557SNQ6_9GAMM|nr:flagellar basal body M-ring protein FliF [Sedimenticola selenatireducens]TVT67226.1 MAG: flagellar basal body M-ring protein FliF [Sedimenticola selenatireducens]
MVGIAASVALGIAVVLWSQTPNYSLLYGNLAQKDASEVVAALEQSGIPYKVNQSTGAVMVDSGKVQEARMKLAGQGLPHSDSLGFEILQQETGFGTSRALEAARFHRALEGELARTIGTLSNIESARVHLATPKKSVFVRKNNNPSASVVLKLYSGRVLDKGQVAAIVHLVASSVPELDSGRITVVDHKGNLLSGEMDSRQMMLTSSQFEYTKELENHYRDRVEEILAPILGADRVRAQVSAEVDFTVTEQTSERFNPDLPALRSEQTNEQLSRLSSVQGVPGALSNQPPAAGNAPEVAAGAEAEGTTGSPLNSSKRSTRNYELDKTISHTRLSSNKLRRLSVAVVVDDLVTLGDDGTTTRIERTPEEISRITRLVRESIGFNAQRGDSVEVINSAFMAPEQPQPLPELAIWQQPWVWDVAKQAGGVILVLILILFVLRPTMKKLIEPPVMHQLAEAQGGATGGASGTGGGDSLDGSDDSMMLPGPERYENTLEAARQMVQDDPKRVAQVIRSWVSDNAG